MKLYIMRHGRAEDRETWGGDDAERPLTDEGAVRTLAAGRGLAALGLQFDAILSSPYTRAKGTAELIAPAFGLPVRLEPALAPGATLEHVATLLAAQADANALLLVGHEPDLSTIIGELIAGGKGAAVAMKKSGCARIDLQGRALRHATTAPDKLAGAGVLVWLLTPTQLAMIGATGGGGESRTEHEQVLPAAESPADAL